MNEINRNQDGLRVFIRPEDDGSLQDDQTIADYRSYRLGHLHMIEQFVRDIEKGWKGGFIVEYARYSGMTNYREQYLDKHYYRLVNGWIRRYSSLHRYSARIETFYDMIEEMNLFDRLGQIPFRFGEPGERDAYRGIRYMDWFGELIERIRERCRSREFKERERLRMINAKRNEENVLALEEEMFSEEGRSRWLILSLTLNYKTPYRGNITPEIIRMHRDKLFGSRRSNKLTAGIKSYACRMEQGSKSGLHLHVILFYSADSNRDELIARQIGEYWENEVTEGKGDYWSSNTGWRKHGYARYGHGLGVGQINWNDFEKREALRRNLIYLTKPEQYLMTKMESDIRTFTMGRVPQKEREGRPRRKLALAEACGSNLLLEKLT